MTREKMLEALGNLKLSLVDPANRELWVNANGVFYTDCEEMSPENELIPDVKWENMEDDFLENWIDRLEESESPNLAEWYDEICKYSDYYEDIETEINITCYSDKGNGGCSFGKCGVVKSVLDFGDCWIYEGIADAFWELYFEFEEDAERARALMKENKDMSWEQAVLEVFGHFHLRVDNIDLGEDFDFGYDVDEQMQWLLETL